MDIEFIAQILLLRFGRKYRQLRLSSRKLYSNFGSDRGGGCVTVGALRPFSPGGKGMRMTSDRADTALPTAAGDLRAPARTVGAQERGDLKTEMKDFLTQTRRIYRRTILEFNDSVLSRQTPGPAPGTTL